ncbi:hypothetical protein O0L34_g10993 [Tuta absoluta]|nr:hypothetical protein O0L34_g10993 [Tuta absoluta]
MLVRLNTNHGYVTLISAYAPTLSSTDEAKTQFNDQLDQSLRGLRPSDRLYNLGDFNTRVGQDNVAWPDCIGNHGIGKLNENGQRLLELCSKHLLCITNTYFKGKSSRKVSWKHPRSGHWHQLDLILTKKKNLRETLHTRTFHSADCDTDHSLVASHVAITHKKIHSSKLPGRKKIDLPKTRDDEFVRKFEELVRDETATWDVDAPIEEDWGKVKKFLTDVTGTAFGH